jgi:hypothetical protein
MHSSPKAEVLKPVGRLPEDFPALQKPPHVANHDKRALFEVVAQPQCLLKEFLV